MNPYKDIYIFLLDLEKIGFRMSIKKPYAHVERCSWTVEGYMEVSDYDRLTEYKGFHWVTQALQL